jgi:hypothetical protein
MRHVLFTSTNALDFGCNQSCHISSFDIQNYQTSIDPCNAILVKSDGKRYCGIILDDGLTWEQANEKCINLGARLPIITTARENEDILNLAVILSCLIHGKYYFCTK